MAAWHAPPRHSVPRSDGGDDDGSRRRRATTARCAAATKKGQGAVAAALAPAIHDGAPVPADVEAADARGVPRRPRREADDGAADGERRGGRAQQRRPLCEMGRQRLVV